MIHDCSIEKTTDGDYVVLNHRTQSVMFEGTKEECIEYSNDEEKGEIR